MTVLQQCEDQKKRTSGSPLSGGYVQSDDALLMKRLADYEGKKD